MPAHPWGASTPEMNAGVLETGSTSATWAAGSAAWMGLATAAMATMGIVAQQMGATLSTMSGVRSATHAAATPPFLAWLAGMAGIAFQRAAVNAVVAESYGLARTTMIPSVQSINNRVREHAAEASNIFGQNTPLIMALNAEYGVYTVDNATIGNTYGEVIAAATLPVPIPPPPPLGSAAQAAADAGQAAQQSAQLVAQAGNGALAGGEPIRSTGWPGRRLFRRHAQLDGADGPDVPGAHAGAAERGVIAHQPVSIVDAVVQRTDVHVRIGIRHGQPARRGALGTRLARRQWPRPAVFRWAPMALVGRRRRFGRRRPGRVWRRTVGGEQVRGIHHGPHLCALRCVDHDPGTFRRSADGRVREAASRLALLRAAIRAAGRTPQVRCLPSAPRKMRSSGAVPKALSATCSTKGRLTRTVARSSEKLKPWLLGTTQLLLTSSRPATAAARWCSSLRIR